MGPLAELLLRCGSLARSDERAGERLGVATDRRSARPRGSPIRSQVAPACGDAISGSPAAAASSRTMPNGSSRVGKAKASASRVVRGHLGVIDEPGELGPVEAELRGELAKPVLLRPGSRRRPGGSRDARSGVVGRRAQKELVDSLVGDQAAGGQDGERFAVARSLAFARDPPEAIESGGVGGEEHPLWADAELDEPLGRGLALRDAGRGGAQQDAPARSAGGGRACSRSGRCRRCR